MTTETTNPDPRISALIIRPGSPAAEPSRIDPDVSLYGSSDLVGV
jgi:hypothetical protein